MDSRIPIPTDNIYKFLATFGLLLMISASTLTIYMYQTTNDIIFKNAAAIYDLELAELPVENKEGRVKLMVQAVKIVTENRLYGTLFFGVLFVVGFFSSVVGFCQWYTRIQPGHDTTIRLQNEKLEAELAALRKTNKEIAGEAKVPENGQSE